MAAIGPCHGFMVGGRTARGKSSSDVQRPKGSIRSLSRFYAEGQRWAKNVKIAHASSQDAQPQVDKARLLL